MGLKSIAQVAQFCHGGCQQRMRHISNCFISAICQLLGIEIGIVQNLN